MNDLSFLKKVSHKEVMQICDRFEDTDLLYLITEWGAVGKTQKSKRAKKLVVYCHYLLKGDMKEEQHLIRNEVVDFFLKKSKNTHAHIDINGVTTLIDCDNGIILGVCDNWVKDEQKRKKLDKEE